MYKIPTLKDISENLKLSQSTVSKALRNSDEISLATKKRVLAYAKELNYHCNINGLALRKRRSYSVGIMVPEIACSFFSQAIGGMESVCQAKGYSIIVSQTNDSYSREISCVNHLAGRAVDGMLISVAAGSKEYTHFKSLNDRGMPMVFFDRILRDFNTFKVTSDNFNGAYAATSRLIADGHRNIGHLTDAKHLSITSDRLRGFKAALTNNGIAYDPEMVIFCDEEADLNVEIKSFIHKAFSSNSIPSAFFLATDRISMAALKVLQNSGYPQVALAGFFNSEAANLLTSSISYVRQPAFDMGKIAAQLLFKILESPRPITNFDTKVLKSELFWNEHQPYSFRLDNKTELLER